MVYEVGVFDFASSCLMLEYAVAIYSSSSLGTDGDNFLAAEMYALSTTKEKFQVTKFFQVMNMIAQYITYKAYKYRRTEASRGANPRAGDSLFW